MAKVYNWQLGRQMDYRFDGGPAKRQFAAVFNTNRCVACQTCTYACKSTWTFSPGQELMWWNNVETKPYGGFPHNWDVNILALQEKANPGGQVWDPSKTVAKKAPYGVFEGKTIFETADGVTSMATGYIPPEEEWKAPNIHEDTATAYSTTGVSLPEHAGWFFYLQRICNHCTYPACLAACPRNAIYKREEDGIVLIDQEKCRGWRMCVSGCPYKKIYFNWASGKSEKCTFCYPRIEAGQPTVCSETCVGRIRYLGVMLYDADRIEEAASMEDEKDLYQAQLDIFLDPHDPEIQAQARKDGVPEAWLEAAKRSPVYKMAIDWKVAFPLHPEYRTLPMVWYVPPLSPIKNAAESGALETDGEMPDVRSLRIPLRYLANLLTAGDEAPVAVALERMLAMRAYMRAKTVEGVIDPSIAERVGLTRELIEDMYHIMAIANYEDRFVIPTSHREEAEEAFDIRGECGFSFGNGCSDGSTKPSLFGGPRRRAQVTPMEKS